MRTLFCVAAIAAAAAASGATCTWKGGSGSFNTAANWEEATVPTTGDDVILRSGSDAVTIENDIAGLSLQSLRIRQGTGAKGVTLTGEGLTLTGSMPFFSDAPVTVDIPLAFTSTCNIGVTNAYTGTFNQPITLSGAITFKIGYYSNKTTPETKYGGNTTFNAAVTGPEATICDGDCNLYAYFYAPVNVYCFHTGSWNSFSPHFYAAGNQWKTNYVAYYAYFAAREANAMPTNMLFLWKPIYCKNSSQSLYNLYKDQTCDRIWCPTLPIYDGVLYNQYRIWGEKGATLTLHGTDDARSCARLEGDLSLVWDPVGDYTQTFAGRTHTTTGTLTVRRGTVALAADSSYQTVFESLTGVVVEDGATLSIEDGCENPFGNGQVQLSVCGSGKIRVPEGVALSLKKLFVSGNPMPANVSYTAATADWITGAGSVTATQTDHVSGTTYWASPVSGLWTNAVQWTDGVPTAETNAFVSTTDADYVITLDAAGAAGNLTLGNASDTATLLITNAGAADASLTIAPDGQLTVKSGGRLLMAGETSALTAGSATGNTGPNGLTVEAGGEVHTSGGTVTLCFNRKGTNAGYAFGLTGGLAEFVDTEIVLKSHQDFSAGQNCQIRTGKGTLRLDGTTRASIDRTDDPGGWVHYTYVQSQNDNEDARMEVLGDSAFTWSSFTFYVGGHSGRSTLLIDTGYTGDLVGAMGISVGYGNGSTGELLVRRGTVAVSPYSFHIGSANTDQFKSYGEYVTGFVEVGAGGKISYSGHGGASPYDQTQWSGNSAWFAIPGLLIGHGLPSQASASGYRGEVRITGGLFEDKYASCLIGTGPTGDGEVIQSGGKFHVMNTEKSYGGRTLSNEVAIACFGGKGVYTMTGGEFGTLRSVYVGGATQEDLHRTITNVVLYAHQFHNANGRLAVAGGTFKASGKIILGADGTGVLDLSSTGTVQAASLIVSNTVDQAASELRFTSDDRGRFGTLDVQTLVFATGSKLVIDATEFPQNGATRTLLSLPNPIEGFDYVKGRVEIVGNTVGGTLRWSPDGRRLRFVARQGCAIMIR